MLGAFSHSFYAMGTVVAILVLSTCIRLTLKVKNPTKDYTELRQRIQSWWIMVLSFIVKQWIAGLIEMELNLISFDQGSQWRIITLKALTVDLEMNA